MKLGIPTNCSDNAGKIPGFAGNSQVHLVRVLKVGKGQRFNLFSRNKIKDLTDFLLSDKCTLEVSIFSIYYFSAKGALRKLNL